MRKTATGSRLTIDRLCDKGCVNVLKAFMDGYNDGLKEHKKHDKRIQPYLGQRE